MPLILPDSAIVPTLVNDTSNVSQEALRALSPDTIQHEITRLQDSVQRLHSSNHQIQHFIHSDPEAADLSTHDKHQLHRACSDNLVTISKQQGLIDRLADILSQKAPDPLSAAHYAVHAPATKQSDSALDTATQSDQQTTQPQPQPPDVGTSGVFL